MAAPPGFNANDTLLPDPGASSAPIHVMRGGGTYILSVFEMGEGGRLYGLPQGIKDGFYKEMMTLKQPFVRPSLRYIKQVHSALGQAGLHQKQRDLVKQVAFFKKMGKQKQNMLHAQDIAEAFQEKQNQNIIMQKLKENTNRVIREGQYIIESGTGKVPAENQPLDIASMIEENPANFSAGVVVGKPSAVRYNASRNFPYSTNAIVGTRKLRISGKTPYYTTKRYGAEMNFSKAMAPAVAEPAKKSGFFGRMKGWFSRKKGGRRRRQRNQKRTLKGRN